MGMRSTTPYTDGPQDAGGYTGYSGSGYSGGAHFGAPSSADASGSYADPFADNDEDYPFQQTYRSDDGSYQPTRPMPSGGHFATGVTPIATPTSMRHAAGGTGGRGPSDPRGGDRPKKKGKAGLVFAIILLIAGIAILAGAGYLFFSSQKAYEDNKAEYHTLAEANVTEDESTGRPIVDFAALKQQNSEIVGWIQIPGTVVNYPVVQHSDNDYYLNHSFLDRYDEFGALFMDYRSSSSLDGRNTVIYGHHLKNGEMLAKVADYSSQEEFDTLQNIYYVTEDGTVHVLVPLCTIVISGTDVDAIQFDFATQADFEVYVQSLIDRSSARSSTATPSGVERIYMLSTCSYATNNERTILVCTDLNGTNGPVVDATQNLSDIQAASEEITGVASEDVSADAEAQEAQPTDETTPEA